MTARPDLSVVVVAYYGFEPLRLLMRHLRAQTIRARIEIVIVGASRAELGVEEDAFDVFFSYQVVELGRIAAPSHARVEGIRAARAPIVALAEDHCFPAPDWAESLVSTHAGNWAGVGPTIGLANPQRYRAWANYLLQYGPWVQPTKGGEITDLPGHNSSYKRDILLTFGDELPDLLVSDTILHWELRRRGYKLFLETRAQAYHVYVTRLVPFVLENYCIGRQFASTRARTWSWPRRMAFACLAPLIPLVRFSRILRRMRQFGWFRDLIPGVLPPLAVGLIVSAAGEFMGCLFGLGRSATRTLELDFGRDRFVSDEERVAIWGDTHVSFRPAAPPSRSAFRRDVPSRSRLWRDPPSRSALRRDEHAETR